MRHKRPDTLTLLAGAAAVAFIAILLAPTFHLGFIADDAPNSLLTQAALRSSGTSLWHFIVKDFSGWMRTGRFFPASHYVRVLFWAINSNLAMYRGFVLLLVIWNVGLFATLVQRLSGSRGLALFSAILVPTLFQVRYYHDPIMSFAGLLQVTLGMTLLSLLFLVMWLDEKRPYQLALSLIFYALSLLTYEIGLPFFLIHAFLIWRHGRTRPLRDVLKTAWPFATLAVADALVPIVFRMTRGVALSGGASAGAWTPHFAPTAILATFAKQTLGALPLTYYVALAVGARLGLAQGFWFGTPVQYALLFPAAAVALIAIALFVATTAARNAHAEASEAVVGRGPVLAGVGIGLWFLPGVLISLSPVRQAEFYWGAAYLPVYLSYFGVALLVLATLGWAARRWPQRVALLALVAGVVVGVLGLTWYGNAVTAVELLNRRWLYPRTLAETAARSDMFDGIEPDSTVLSSDARFWDDENFFTHLGTARPKKVIHLAEKSTTPTLTAYVSRMVRASKPVYYLDYDARSDGSGYALLAQISTLTARPDGGFGIQGTPIAYFVQAPAGRSSASQRVSSLLPTEAALPTASELGLPTAGTQIPSGAGGTLTRYSGSQAFAGVWLAGEPWWR